MQSYAASAIRDISNHTLRIHNISETDEKYQERRYLIEQTISAYVHGKMYEEMQSDIWYRIWRYLNIRNFNKYERNS